MKNLTNILSYLWLLLLMAVTACSDMENEVDEMQQQLQEADLVELTIHPHVPGMKAGTRSTETDALTSIKVLAFDESKKLIKMVDATNVTTGTSGSFSVKVPSKTRIIHFIGNLPNDVTLPVVGDSEDKLKTITTSSNMSYWGYASFDNATDLKAFKGKTLTFYRNKAKISLTAADDVTASIAGVANAYQYGVLVPHNDGGFNFDLNTYDYQTLPSNTAKISDQTGGAFTYVFEHPNDSKADALNVICLVDGKYYKVALAKKVDDVMVYYDIIRNHQYNIKINQVDTNLGKDDFDDAADADNEPINDVEVVEDKQVALQVTTSSSSTRSYDNTTYTVTVTTTENKLTDISTLSFSGLNADIYELTGTPTGVTDNGNSTYTVTDEQAVFTFTLKDGYIGKEVSNSITFAGAGTHVVVTTATANLNLSTFADMYEMYFDGGNLGGSNEYDKFFYDRNNVNLHTQTLTTQYVDAGANGSSLAHNHVSAAINMQSNSMIKFTIAEERYLTLLVARKDNAPSIDLQKDGKAWTATSNDTQVPVTYNFSKDGDITTSGRLIRYTLPAGTYTLQQGNNDYLLYYMRVSKDRPTMTDANALLQPTNDNYRFWWSGGEYGNWTNVENVGYVVDDDAKTFNVALTDQYLNNNGITAGELSLNSLQLNVTNSILNNHNQTYTANSGSKVEISEINAGTYTYTIGAGVINNPVYKYTNFYDKIPVNAVNNGSKTITVKNSLKLKLVNGETSYNGKENIVEYYTTEMTDPRLAIVSPAAPLKPHDNNNSFVCTIENWQFKGANNKQIDSNGQQVNLVSQYGNTFTIANGTEHYNNNENWKHPFWLTYIYYFDWGSFKDENNTNRTLSYITIETEDVDVWFSYKGLDIAKNLTIKVKENPGEVVEPEGLDIALDFYVDNPDGGNGQYNNNNLVFGVTNLYLKVTIPENVAAGTRIELDMKTDGSRGWINEWNSRNETLSSGVSYRYQEGITGLVLTAEADRRDYLMCWTFVRSDNNIKDEVPITYELTSNTHTLSGETIANLTINGNNKQIQVSAHDRPAAGKINIPLQYGTGTREEFTVDVVVPDGVTEIKIEAADFDVAWSDGNGNVSNALTYSFPTKENLTHRFKFTLKEGSKSVKTSNIFFSCDDKYVANGTVVVDLSQRSAETVPAGGTTIWSGLAQLEWSVNYLSIPNTIAKGSTVRLNFTTTGGAFKLHDGNGQAFKLSNENYSHQQNNDTYLNVSSGQTYYEFIVDNINEGTDITNGLQGLKVNGNNITMTSIVVYEGSTSNESVVYEVDFRNVTKWDLWCQPDDVNALNYRKPTVDSQNGFCLSNPEKCSESEGWLPQYHLAYGLALEAGTYKLTMRIRGDNAEGFDTKQLNIGLSCWAEGNSRLYTTMSFSDSWSDVSVNVTLSQNTTNSGAGTDGFVMCQSGSFIGDLYIQWLRIEKTSQ